MSTEKPLLLMIPPIRETEALLELTLLTLEAGIFYQMRVPLISLKDCDEWLARAQAAAIGYVVSPAHQNINANAIWLIVLENGSLWRWSLVPVVEYDAACEEHTWLANVPQIFLVGQPPVEHEGYPAYRSRRPTEEGDEP